MAYTKRLFWTISGLIVLGLIVFVFNANRWMARSTDVCGYTIAPVPAATQQAMQRENTSIYILEQAYKDHRIGRDQYYLYLNYLFGTNTKTDPRYPQVLKGSTPYQVYWRGINTELKEQFCMLSPCVQGEINTTMFDSRLSCIEGTVVVKPRLTPTP